MILSSINREICGLLTLEKLALEIWTGAPFIGLRPMAHRFVKSYNLLQLPTALDYLQTRTLCMLLKRKVLDYTPFLLPATVTLIN